MNGKQCSECRFYDPIKGQPPAGWCEFTTVQPLPFWMEKNRNNIERLGADVLAGDGTDCEAFEPPASRKSSDG